MAEWVYFNPNPAGARTGDCVIRAICAATGQDWDTTYTVGEFADDRPDGTYILGTGTHAVAVVSGAVVDSWDSRGEVPDYYFIKR